MRQFASLVVSFVMLLFSVSANAFSYTTSAFETLTFSGIDVAVFPAVADARNSLFDSQGNGFSFENFPLSLPGTGAAQSTSYDGGLQVSSYASLVGSDYATAAAYSGLIITANEIGWLTVKVDYRFEETGTVPLGGSLQYYTRSVQPYRRHYETEEASCFVLPCLNRRPGHHHAAS